MNSIWRQKGATLSDKSARQGFGLTQQEIYEATRTGKLQFQQNNMHGNPWFRLLRHEVEAFVAEKGGQFSVSWQRGPMEDPGIRSLFLCRFGDRPFDLI
jgi:hypothetical protein